MNESIFSQAKFGDRFMTRDGRIAIYHSYNNIYPDNPYESHHNLLLEEKDAERDTIWILANDYGHTEEHIGGVWLNENNSDIVSRWYEPVDEEKLDELAIENTHERYYYTGDTKGVEDFQLGFKSGYKFAKKE